MSWFPTPCPNCHQPSRFISTLAHGPDCVGALEWRCDACAQTLVEWIPLGRADTGPGDCLNCVTARAPNGECPACAAVHEQLVTRVHEHCGSPPQIERIDELRACGLYRVAINAVLMRLQCDRCDHEALALYGLLLLDLERPAAAVPVLRQALACGAGPGPMINLGVALADSGEPRKAIDVYERYLAQYPHDPGHAMVLSNIGGCHSALGQPRKGERFHRRAIKRDPEHLFPRWNLFANLLGQGRIQAALQVVEQTLELPVLDDDERENLHAYRADMLMRLRRYDEALAAIDLSLVGHPDDPDRQFTRARIVLGLGHTPHGDTLEG